MPETREQSGSGGGADASKAASETAPRTKRLVRWLKHIGRPALDRFLARRSTLGDPVRFDPALFPWTKKLEAHVEEIRAEILRLSQIHDVLPTFDRVSPYQSRISRDDCWKTAYLYGFGETSEAICRICPRTAALVAAVPGLRSATFSLLAPDARIPAHRGVFKGILNYHLGIIVPKQPEKARIRVADEYFFWEAGRSYVFDDTYEHEVWNQSGEERVVLFLQFDRPMTRVGRWVSGLFLRVLRWTPYLRVPIRNVRGQAPGLLRTARERGLL